MEDCSRQKEQQLKGSEAGTNMRGRGTAWRPVGLEWREGRESEVGDDVGDGYDRGF